MARPFTIKSVILYYVFAMYAWPAIRSRQANDASSKQSVQQQSAKRRHSNKLPTGRVNYQSRYEKSKSNNTDDDDEWNLTFGMVPRMPKLGRFIYCLSTLTHAYVFVCGVLFRDRMLDTSGSRYYYYSCLLPRPIIIGLLSQKMTIELFTCIALMHLVWRILLLSILKDRLMFDVVKFLLADEQILDKVRIATEFGPEFVDDFGGFFSDQTSAQFEILRDCLYFPLKLNSSLATKSCLQRPEIEYVLRPNRTIEWHRKFQHLIGLVARLSCTLFGLAVAPLALNVAHILLFNQQIMYTGCDVLHARSPLYWMRILGSGLVGCVALIDAFAAIVCASSLCGAMIYDLLVYWSHLQLQLDTARRQVPTLRAVEDSYSRHRWRSHRLFRPAEAGRQWTQQQQQQQQPNHHKPIGGRVRGQTVSMLDDDWHSISAKRPTRGGRGSGRQPASLIGDGERTEIRYARIRAGLVDFFGQLNRVDGFINVLTTETLCIWLLINALLILTGFQFSAEIESANQLIMRFVQSLGFVLVSFVCWPSLEMRRRIESVYIMLCTLMAHDSNSGTNRWNELLIYYTEKPRYSFTIFDDRIFTRLIYGKILSFTVTFIFVLESLQLAELTFGSDESSGSFARS